MNKYAAKMEHEMPMSISVANVLKDRIPEVRHASGVDAEGVSDLRIERLLRSYFFDVSSTAAAVCRHHDLASWADSRPTSYYVEEAISSQRFRYIGLNRERSPIVVIDWLWGQFLNVPGGLETLMEAYVVFMRRTSARVKAELGTTHEDPEFIFMNVGGPPPMDFMKEMLQMRSVDFPEVISDVILYPMDPSTALGEMILGFIRGCSTSIPKCAFKMAATVNDLIESTKAFDGLIPNDVLYRDAPTEDEREAIKPYRRDMFMAPPMQGPIDVPLPSDVVVKNTFLDVGANGRASVASALRRSNSFDGAANGERRGDVASMQDGAEPTGAKTDGSAASECSTTDTPPPEHSALTDAASSAKHEAYAAAPGLPPCVDELLTPLLRNVPPQEMPDHLDWNATILREAANYLATLAEQARVVNDIQAWQEMVDLHKSQYPATGDVMSISRKSQLNGQPVTELNLSAALSTEAASASDAAASKAKGPSGAQRRKQKKAAAKRHEDEA